MSFNIDVWISWAGSGIGILLTRNVSVPDATRRDARTLAAVSVKRPVGGTTPARRRHLLNRRQIGHVAVLASRLLKTPTKFASWNAANPATIGRAGLAGSPAGRLTETLAANLLLKRDSFRANLLLTNTLSNTHTTSKNDLL